tara:strand:+ start:8439 stop:8588 length:150 start_codon:yes stop_codon:yes gene_type:complete
MSLKQELEQAQAQQEQAKTLWTKLQGVIEYLEGRIKQEKEEKKSSKSKK